MTRGKTRVLMAIMALALIVTLAAPAYALGEVDLEAEASVVLSVANEAFREDLTGSAVTVLVYKLASMDANGVFTPEADFQALAEDAALWNGGVLGNELVDVQGLMEAAENLIFYGSVEAPEPPAEGEESEPAPVLPESFRISVEPVQGTISLTEYGKGLYLLLPQQTETAQWRYTFSPALVALPSVERQAAEGETGIPAEGHWQYNVPVALKAEQVSLLTDIVIEKSLREYNASLGATTFLFEVRAELDGEIVYSNVVSLTFSGAGTQSVTVQDIPAGAHVTVTEVYSGGSYEVADGQASVDIPALALPEGDEVTRVAFTNTYTDERIPDGSVVNRYVYDGTGWDYQEEAGQ